jgi:hypothetical protein
VETNDVERRLRELGGTPVDPAVRRSHLAAMAAVDAPRERHRRFGWRSVAAATIVGFLAGSTGLAAAGSLPDTAQDVAHDVLAKVGVDVPRSTEGCPDGATYRNHGEYVSEVEAGGGDAESAARSACGKPVPPGQGQGQGEGHSRSDGTPRADTDGDPCTGPPPWAGAHVSAEERSTMRADRAAQCPDEPDADEPDVDDRSTTTTG